MNCDQVQGQLTAWELGELDGRPSRRLEAHLDGCAACRRARREHQTMTSLLAGYAPPIVPEGFGSALHARLSERSVPAFPSAPHAASPSPWWRAGAKTTGALAAGVLLGALGLWLATPHGVDGGSHAGGATVLPSPERAAATQLRAGEVGVVTLVVHVAAAHRDAALEVVLPDGLTLVGEGLAEYPEKQLRWRSALKSGANRIRVPVRAKRPGRWQVVARVRAGALRTTTQVELEVTS